jgi:UDP-glucose 4-epimerase
MLKILVTGATGALGPTVVRAMHNANLTLCVLAIDAPKSGLLPPAVEIHLGDITHVKDVQAAMCSVDAVIHMAALLHIVNPPTTLRPQYERINVEGTRTVVDAALKAGVQRLVFFSTIAVYGYGQGRLLTEESIPHPDTFYAETKLAAEQIVLAARRVNGQPLGVVLRLGAVYGARIKGNYQRLVHALARKRFLPIGKGENRRTLVYDKDVARAVLLAVQHPAAAGRVYNVTDGEMHTVSEINQAICTALGRTPPGLCVPVAPVRAAAGLVEDVARLLCRQSSIGRATIDKYTEDVAVDGKRIQTELGFQPAYDLATGWTDAVQEMRRQGAL